MKQTVEIKIVVELSEHTISEEEIRSRITNSIAHQYGTQEGLFQFAKDANGFLSITHKFNECVTIGPKEAQQSKPTPAEDLP